MYKISESKLTVGAASFIYRQLAELLREMHVYYQQPRHQLTIVNQQAWCCFKETMVIEVAGWLQDRHANVPVINLCTSGLSSDESEVIIGSLSPSEQLALAKNMHWGTMRLCERVHQIIKMTTGQVDPDVCSARRQLRKWCALAAQEYRRKRNDSIPPAGVNMPTQLTRSRVGVGYMVPTGGW